MNNKEVEEALKKAKDISQKRNFKQTIDLIINLKELNLKSSDNQLNLFMTLPHPTGKQVKVCGLVGPELADHAKEVFDNVVNADDFDKYAKDAKLTKKLADDYDYFVAQANIMPKVATAFGRVLGTRGKMPNPKAGCVVPPSANLKPLYKNLQRTAKIIVKSVPIVQCRVGNEDSPEKDVIENVMAIYDNVIHHLPNEQDNIKNVIVKLTMGPAVVVGKKTKTKEEPAKESGNEKAAAEKQEAPKKEEAEAE